MGLIVILSSKPVYMYWSVGPCLLQQGGNQWAIDATTQKDTNGYICNKAEIKRFCKNLLCGFNYLGVTIGARSGTLSFLVNVPIGVNCWFDCGRYCQIAAGYQFFHIFENAVRWSDITRLQVQIDGIVINVFTNCRVLVKSLQFRCKHKQAIFPVPVEGFTPMRSLQTTSFCNTLSQMANANIP